MVLTGFATMGGLTPSIIILIVWTVIWKGIALWKAAKNNSIPWFVALFVLNTAGILEILYIFIFSKMKKTKAKKKTSKRKKR